MLTDIVFWILAVLAVAAGIAVFSVDSMARATYALAVSFVAVGGTLLVLNLSFGGVITVLMMVMEMAIMAIYMIMFMGMNPALMPMSMHHNKGGAMAIAVVTFLLLAVGAFLVPWPTRRSAPAADLVPALGEAVMGSKMLVMLTVSPVLFATIIAALVLANPRTRYDRLGNDLRRPAADREHVGLPVVTERAGSRRDTAAPGTRPPRWGYLPLAGDSEEDS